MDPLVHLTSPLSSLSCNVFAPFFCQGLRGDRSNRVWFGAPSKNECESDQPMRAQLGSTPFAVRGRSSSFHPFFNTAWDGNISAWLMRRDRLHFITFSGLRERATPLPGSCGEVVFTPFNKQILRFCLTFSGIDHNLHLTVKLKMSKNSVNTILITLCSSTVQDPEPF